MLSKPEREQIIALIKREVVPAIGCTEPIAVALCVAKAREILGTEPEKVSARLSANILKNAMGVGIPGTGMIGLPIAIALGALVGRSEYQLEVLKDSDAKAVERGKRFIEQGRIDISLKEGIGRRTLRCGDHRRRAYEFRLHFTGRRNASGESSYLRQRTGGAGRRTQPAQSV